MLQWRRFPQNPPRDVLLNDSRLLVPDFTWFSIPTGSGAPNYSRPRCLPPSRRHLQSCCCCLFESRPARVLLQSLSSRHWCGCSGRCAWWCCVSCLMPRIHRERLKVEASAPALCPVRLSSEAPIRDGRRHWLSLVRFSLLDPWSHVARRHQPVPD